MNKKICTLLLILSAMTVLHSQAQMPKRPIKKAYISTDFDLLLFSTSVLDKPSMERTLTPLRFTAIPFLGININYDLGKKIGLYTGVNIKNIGFIEKFSNPDSTVKRRAYTIGAPIGLKIGNIQYGNYVILGVGVDFPFHYKEKGFTDRGSKTKFTEWFSDRTIRVMPYAFVGVHLMPALTVKVQYYAANFLNQHYKTTDAAGKEVRPYSSYYVPTIMLTAGIDIPFVPKN